MNFLKLLGGTIFVICMAIALIYGLIDIAQLTADLGVIAEGTNPMTVWQPHLKEITFAGLSLAILFLGWEEWMEYFEEEEE